MVGTIEAAVQQGHLHIFVRSLRVLPKPVWVFSEHIFPPTVRLGEVNWKLNCMFALEWTGNLTVAYSHLSRIQC